MTAIRPQILRDQMMKDGMNDSDFLLSPAPARSPEKSQRTTKTGAIGMFDNFTDTVDLRVPQLFSHQGIKEIPESDSDGADQNNED